MNFGEVLSRAWRIIWRHKVLWVFGLLAGLVPTGDNGSSTRYELNDSHWLNAFFNNIPAWAWLLLGMLSLVLLVLAILISAVGRAGLMRGAWLADNGENHLSFRQLFDAGKTYFGRVLMLEILMFGLSLSLILVLLIPAVLTLGIALLCLWPLIILLVPVFIGLSVLTKLAIAAITGENLGVMEGLQRGWAVLRANLLQIAAIAFVLWLIGSVVGAIAGVPAMAMLAPLAYSSSRGGALIGVMLFLIYLPILLVVSGLLTSYFDSVWTVVFRRLTGRNAADVLETPAAQENVS